MSEKSFEQEREGYKQLFEGIKGLLYAAKFQVAVALLKMKYSIGDMILSYSPTGKFPEGKPDKARLFPTLTKLAQDLNSEYPKITSKRLSEFVQFRKMVGENFDVWAETTKNTTGLNRTDIRWYLMNSQPEPKPKKEVLPTSCEQCSPSFPKCCPLCPYFKK